MMAGLPIFARANSGDAVASYDWLDITSGAGYRTYYLASAKDDAATTYFLTTKIFDSSYTATNVTGLNLDKDFDITMKVPSIIGGADVIINFTWYVPNAITPIFTVTLYHVTAAGVETSLGASTITRAATANWTLRECFKIALASTKKFAIGEKIRINLSMNSDAGVLVYIDPSSNKTYTETTTTRTIGSDFVVNIPFKIDI